MDNKVYSEVYSVLNLLNEDDLRKIPEDILFFIKANIGEDTDYMDKNQSFDEINITSEAEDMLALLTYHYLCDDTEKSEMNKLMDENEKKHQEELKEKYNPDDVFNNVKSLDVQSNSENINSSSVNTNNSNIKIADIMVTKESFISKIINKLKGFFKRK